MTKTEKLKAAYNDLKSGKIIEFIPDNSKTTFGCKCWIGKSSNPNCKRKFIFWHRAGSSANNMSLTDLRWIARKIGDCTSYNYKIVQSIYGGV